MAIPAADLIVLPGSKNVRADLDWLRAQGWEAEIRRHLRYGGKVIGICGGMQMLGAAVHDPLGIEGAAAQRGGLGAARLRDHAATGEAPRARRRHACWARP